MLGGYSLSVPYVWHRFGKPFSRNLLGAPEPNRLQRGSRRLSRSDAADNAREVDDWGGPSLVSRYCAARCSHSK